MPKPVEGVFAFSVTPSESDGSIDYPRWMALADEMIAQGIHGITLFGSTGSNGYFTEAEKTEALEKMSKHIAGRVPLMFGVGAMTTAECVRMAKRAEGAGVDALLVIPLNYWTPTEREILAHYETVGRASNVPLWVYNNGLAGIDLTPAIMQKLGQAVPSIVGMKDSSGDLTRVLTIPKLTNGKVKVGLGQDTLILEPAVGPAPGWFTGLGNFLPAQCVAFWNAAKSGDVTKAYGLAKALFEISEIGGRYGIVRVAHQALTLMGKSAGSPRAPMLDLDAAGQAELKGALAKFEGLKAAA